MDRILNILKHLVPTDAGLTDTQVLKQHLNPCSGVEEAVKSTDLTGRSADKHVDYEARFKAFMPNADYRQMDAPKLEDVLEKTMGITDPVRRVQYIDYLGHLCSMVGNHEYEYYFMPITEEWTEKFVEMFDKDSAFANQIGRPDEALDHILRDKKAFQNRENVRVMANKMSEGNWKNGALMKETPNFRFTNYFDDNPHTHRAFNMMHVCINQAGEIIGFAGTQAGIFQRVDNGKWYCMPEGFISFSIVTRYEEDGTPIRKKMLDPVTALGVPVKKNMDTAGEDLGYSSLTLEGNNKPGSLERYFGFKKAPFKVDTYRTPEDPDRPTRYTAAFCQPITIPEGADIESFLAKYEINPPR